MSRDSHSSHLAAVLDDIEEFLEGQQDVVDGSYGEPRPNRAMSLLSELQVARVPAGTLDEVGVKIQDAWDRESLYDLAVIARDLLTQIRSLSAPSDTRDTVLVEALQQWKCPSCGGTTKYTNRSIYGTEVVPCRKCDDSGLHPIAAAALKKAALQARTGENPIVGQADRLSNAGSPAESATSCVVESPSAPSDQATMIALAVLHDGFATDTSSRVLAEEIQRLDSVAKARALSPVPAVGTPK